MSCMTPKKVSTISRRVFGIQALPMNSMRAKCRATGTWKGCAGCSSFRGSGYSGLGSFGCCMLWALWAWTCSLRFVEPSCLHCRLQGRTERQERRDDMGYGSLVLRIHPTVTASQRLPQTLSNRHPRQLKPSDLSASSTPKRACKQVISPDPSQRPQNSTACLAESQQDSQEPEGDTR